MLKPVLILSLALFAVPLVASADPMSVGEGAAFAANTPSPAIDNSARIVSDTEEGGNDATPETPAPAAATHVLRQDAPTPGNGQRANPRPHPAAADAHKKPDTTHWQSLLPGVMK